MITLEMERKKERKKERKTDRHMYMYVYLKYIDTKPGWGTLDLQCLTLLSLHTMMGATL